MAKFKISGVWMDAKGVITHYAFHRVRTDYRERAVKISKKEAIALLEEGINSAVTWEWNYLLSTWVDGESVEVVKRTSGKYLRTDPDNSLTDNLAHLLDYDWLQS